MAQWHLDELLVALERLGWRVTTGLPGNGYDISATWSLVRSGAEPAEVLLDFEGLEDMNTLPITQSYACTERGSERSLYFRRRGDNDPPARDRWLRELDLFVRAIGNSHAV